MTRMATIVVTVVLLIASARGTASDADERRAALNDVLTVMGYVRTSLAMADMCIERAPDSAAQTRASRDAWQHANAEVLRYLASAYDRAIADASARHAGHARVLRDEHERTFAHIGHALRIEFDALPDATARCEDYRLLAANSRLARDFVTWLARAKRVYADPGLP